MKSERNNENFLRHVVVGEELFLLPEKAIFWPGRRILLIADLHLGKSTHFRKRGVNVPLQVLHEDLSRLTRLIQSFDPERVIFLGDLFHSHKNSEWEVFGEWTLSYPLKWELIKGNHDLLSFDAYDTYNIRVQEAGLILPPFTLTHFPPLQETDFTSELYYLSGHIHPAVQLSGAAYQSLRLPCFIFGKKNGILPAFGRFTGTEIITPRKPDRIFVIAKDHVLDLKR
jgi:DNA ligase-associated metallophosphoesterase